MALALHRAEMNKHFLPGDGCLWRVTRHSLLVPTLACITDLPMDADEMARRL